MKANEECNIWKTADTIVANRAEKVFKRVSKKGD